MVSPPSADHPHPTAARTGRTQATQRAPRPHRTSRSRLRAAGRTRRTQRVPHHRRTTRTQRPHTARQACAGRPSPTDLYERARREGREPADRPRTTTLGRVSAQPRTTTPGSGPQAGIPATRSPGLQHRAAVPARSGLFTGPGLQHRAAVPAGSRLPARPGLRHRAGLRTSPGLQHRPAVPARSGLPAGPGLRPQQGQGPARAPRSPQGGWLPRAVGRRTRPGPSGPGPQGEHANRRLYAVPNFPGPARRAWVPGGPPAWARNTGQSLGRQRAHGPVRRRTSDRAGRPRRAGPGPAGRNPRGLGDDARPSLRTS